MQSPQVGHGGKEELLLLCDFGLDLGRRGCFIVWLLSEVDERARLVACLVRNLQDRDETRLLDQLVDSHDCWLW